ncbi:uncharacterized protein N7529_008883 [Penicillium soppii]|jgi:hypothetical protein|uniref:uncharacterized protein n=1 Tax=Penicillium soppii TaxID=69789 RepID=UPI002546A2A7|nr:uncharacterized protein N7529_008883 [Penicillium soppii]KAJ5861573.1 hypothetical protein N7529_008883 [Penicillium soppii]
MSQCLRFGRILPFGRRPTVSRPSSQPYRTVSPFSRPTWSNYNRQTRKRQKETNYPDEITFLRRYNNLAEPPLTYAQTKDINEWILLLRRYVTIKSPNVAELASQPRRLRPLRESHSDLDRIHALMGCLWAARNRLGFEVLTHLGFELKEWSTAQSLLNNMIDTYELLQPHMPPKYPSPGFDWNRPFRILRKNERKDSSHKPSDAKESPLTTKVSLDKLTGGTKEGSPWKWTRLEPVPAENISLDTLTVAPAVRFFGDRILAEILANLGSLVLTAADSQPEQSQLAMSCVFRTLARLHHAGMISDRVYQYPTPDASQIVYRPPGLHLLSSPIMSVLSDAAWHEHQTAVATAAADAGEMSPFIPYKMGIRELGPEIWLELILSCCVEHGFCKTGALLVHRIAKSTGKQAWKAESWTPLIQDLDTVQQTNISIEKSWRRPGQSENPQTYTGKIKPPFNGLGSRTISKEVVASLRSGLANKAYVGLGERGYLPDELAELSTPLTQFIDRPVSTSELMPTNRDVNWHILRILSSGCLQPWTDPVSFESLLRSHPNVVPPWAMHELEKPQELGSKTRAQIYDETAAIFGMIEFNLNYHARYKQSGRLFHEYAWLQNIADASKAQHVQSFLGKLSQARDGDEYLSFLETKPVSPQSIYQSSIPQVSWVTLANILDLATTAHAFDLGRQLLLQNDIDGPAIPERAYGNQALAPSILRFATATNDASLGQKVIASLSVPLSLNTIKSLISYHISMQDWDRVEFMLKFMTEHREKSWGYSTLTAIATAVIRHEAALRQNKAAGTLTRAHIENTERATDILFRIFRGEWSASSTRTKVRLFQLRTLSRMHRVLLSIPGPLPEVFKRLEAPKEITDRHKIALIPPNSFHEIFAAIVETQGAIVGKQVWDRHCIDLLSPKRGRQAPGGVPRLLFSDERRKELGDPEWSGQWANEILTKSTLADLNTVRVLARAAVREYADQSRERYHAKIFQSETDYSATPSSSSSSSSSFIYDPTKPYVPHTTREENPYQRAGGRPPRSELEAILDFCLELFIRFGLPEDQINMEIPGHLHRMQERGAMAYPFSKHIRRRIQFNKADRFMDSSWRVFLRGDSPSDNTTI